MTADQVAWIRKQSGSHYIGCSDLEVERGYFRLCDCSTEALVEELYTRGWLVIVHSLSRGAPQ